VGDPEFCSRIFSLVLGGRLWCYQESTNASLICSSVCCSRDLLICKRCKAISAVCEYPPPPDRKRLAAQRLQNVKARVRRESDSSNGAQRRQKQPDDSELSSSHRPGPSVDSHDATISMGRSGSDAIRHVHRASSSEDYRVSTPPLQATLRRTTLALPEVATFFFETYFSRLCNTSLLFHKQIFLS
jgi:hypothetical protein